MRSLNSLLLLALCGACEHRPPTRHDTPIRDVSAQMRCAVSERMVPNTLTIVQSPAAFEKLVKTFNVPICTTQSVDVDFQQQSLLFIIARGRCAMEVVHDVTVDEDTLTLRLDAISTGRCMREVRQPLWLVVPRVSPRQTVRLEARSVQR